MLLLYKMIGQIHYSSSKNVVLLKDSESTVLVTVSFKYVYLKTQKLLYLMAHY